MLDRRVWTPDESCLPFTLETIQPAPVVGDVLIRFSIPSLMVMVMTDLLTFGAAAAKSAQQVMLRRGRGGDNATPLSFYGGLVNVQEFANAGTLVLPGFSNVMKRTCRIVLTDPGDYEFFWGGPNAGANTGIAVNGYTFPLHKR